MLSRLKRCAQEEHQGKIARRLRALTNQTAADQLAHRLRPAPTSHLRLLVSEECRAEKELLYLFLQPRGQVGGVLEFSHTIVPDRHKDDAWIAYGPIYSVLDETNDAEHPAGQDHPGIGRSLMECQRVNRIAVLPFVPGIKPQS